MPQNSYQIFLPPIQAIGPTNLPMTYTTQNGTQAPLILPEVVIMTVSSYADVPGVKAALKTMALQTRGILPIPTAAQGGHPLSNWTHVLGQVFVPMLTLMTNVTNAILTTPPGTRPPTEAESKMIPRIFGRTTAQFRDTLAHR